jgi:hypothetical protein
MSREEIRYWPSRAKQLLYLAILFFVFILATAGFVFLWLIEPDKIADLDWRTTLVGIYPVLLTLLAVLAVFGAVSMPILLVMMLHPSPVLVLTSRGMRLRTIDLRWEEIEEIHEYVHNQHAPGVLQQVLLGLYLRDEKVISVRLSYPARWQLGNNKKQGLPPIVVATHHLHERVEDLLDDIEAYLAELQDEKGKRRRLPKVYRRKD